MFLTKLQVWAKSGPILRRIQLRTQARGSAILQVLSPQITDVLPRARRFHDLMTDDIGPRATITKARASAMSVPQCPALPLAPSRVGAGQPQPGRSVPDILRVCVLSLIHISEPTRQS